MTQAISFLDTPSPQIQPITKPTTLITHARLPGHDQQICLWVDPLGTVRSIQTIAQAFKQPPPERLQVLNLKGEWLSLGGVDLQINGALGLSFNQFNDDNADKLEDICQFLWHQGIESFLPTLVTTSIERTQCALGVLARYVQQHPQPGTAKILGIHLEGPFLNPAKRGAHPQEYLLPLTLDSVKQVLGDYTSLVKMVTLAPELDPTGEVIAYLRSHRIAVSLGHSQATAAQAQTAFKQGAALVTHAFNAMPPLHHREVGLLGAALAQPGVHCGLIADGEHVSPLMLDLLMKIQGCSDKLFLVSDALAPLGLEDGTYPWDTRTMEVNDGTARLADGTLAGTTLPLLVGVQNLVRWNICSVDNAIALATTAPRRILGTHCWEKSKRDRPFIGRPANQLLRWHLNSKTRELSWERLVTTT